MNDTHRKLDGKSYYQHAQSSDDSAPEITNRSFGDDFRGDLKSQRVRNQSNLDRT